MNNIGMLGEAEALADAVDLGDSRKMVDAGGRIGVVFGLFVPEVPSLKIGSDR